METMYNLFPSLALIAFCILMIWLATYLRTKKIKKLEEKGLEIDFATKINPWKTYIISSVGIAILVFDIIKRLFFN